MGYSHFLLDRGDLGGRCNRRGLWCVLRDVLRGVLCCALCRTLSLLLRIDRIPLLQRLEALDAVQLQEGLDLARVIGPVAHGLDPVQHLGLLFEQGALGPEQLGD